VAFYIAKAAFALPSAGNALLHLSEIGRAKFKIMIIVIDNEKSYFTLRAIKKLSSNEFTLKRYCR
jgi:deoxyxylulose-5-phosphate synthase